MLLSREDEDLGVASHAPPGSQASPRGEAKDSALLPSRNADILVPPEWPQGSPASSLTECEHTHTPLENPWDRGAWQATVHRVAKSQTKFGKLSSGHRTGKVQFSFQSQRKAMPKNAQTTAQLYSSYTSSKATLWGKAHHEGALPPPCIVRKDPRVPHTARRGA